MTYDERKVYEVRGVPGVFVAIHVRETPDGIAYDDTSHVRLLPAGAELVPMTLDVWNAHARERFNEQAPRFASREEMVRALYGASGLGERVRVF